MQPTSFRSRARDYSLLLFRRTSTIPSRLTAKHSDPHWHPATLIKAHDESRPVRKASVAVVAVANPAAPEHDLRQTSRR